MTNPVASVGSSGDRVSDNEKHIETTRSIAGLVAVVSGDVVIALAAIIAVYQISTNQTSSSAIVSILTSAFTAIGTLTTAYFGIKAASNTAQSSVTKAGVGRNVPAQSPPVEAPSKETEPQNGAPASSPPPAVPQQRPEPER